VKNSPKHKESVWTDLRYFSFLPSLAVSMSFISAHLFQQSSKIFLRSNTLKNPEKQFEEVEET